MRLASGCAGHTASDSAEGKLTVIGAMEESKVHPQGPDIRRPQTGPGSAWNRSTGDGGGASDWPLCIAIGALLLVVYLLTFSGQLRSIDEYAMYAATESVISGDGAYTPQLAFAAEHNPVGSIEPGQPLLAVPLYLLGRHLPGASTISTVMLLNTLVTACTGALLCRLLRALRYSAATSAVTAVAWGIGTSSWAYSRSFFREPLNGLVWVLATYLLVRLKQTNRTMYLLAMVLVLSAGLAVKASSAVAIPVFGLALLWDTASNRIRFKRRDVILLCALGITAMVVGLSLEAAGLARSLNRLWYWLSQYDIRVAALRAYGAMLSPIKGLFLYSPLLLAAAIGWRRFYTRNRLVILVAAGITLALLAVYGALNAWHGGRVVWGPRYHIPLLPLLVLPYAAALELTSRRSRIWIALWTAVSLILQIAASTTFWGDAVLQMIPAYESERLVGLDGIPWYSLKLLSRSPAIVKLVGWHPGQLDMSWLRAMSDGTIWIDAPLVIILSLLSVAIAALCRKMVQHGRSAMRHRTAISSLVVVAALAAMVLTAQRTGANVNDVVGLARADGQQLAQAVSQEDATYTVILVSNEFYVNYWLGLLNGDYHVHWYSPYDERGLSSALDRVPSGTKVWLVLDLPHLPPDAEPMMARSVLARGATELSSQWVGDLQVIEFAPRLDTDSAQDTLDALDATALRLRDLIDANDLVVYTYRDDALGAYLDSVAETGYLDTGDSVQEMAVELACLIRGGQRVVVVSWARDPEPPRDMLHWYLQRNGHLVERLIAADRWISVYSLDDEPRMPDTVSLSAGCGSISLTGVSLPEGLPQDEECAVAVDWQPGSSDALDHKASIRVIDRGGHVIASEDRYLFQGDTSQRTARLEAGQEYRSYYTLALPAGTPPQSYDVEMVIYREEATAGASLDSGTQDICKSQLGQLTVWPPLEASDPFVLPPDAAVVGQEVAPGLMLEGIQVTPRTVRPGDEVSVALYWTATSAPLPAYEASLQVMRPSGSIDGSSTGPFVYGDYGTEQWTAGQLVRENRSVLVEPDTEPGAAEIVIAVNGNAVGLLGITIEGEQRDYAFPDIAHETDVLFDGVGRLVGYELSTTDVSPGEDLVITLYWRAVSYEPLTTRYTVFVHLIDSSGSIIAQDDSIPAQGAWPTTAWLKDQAIVDSHRIALSDTEYQGTARIRLGLYDAASGVRVLTEDGQDHIVLMETVALSGD